MKVLVLYDYPPSPGGLATQGDLLYHGLKEMGVDVHAVNSESPQEKEWYYSWFQPDLVIGVGYWGHTPHLILHPRRHGMLPVPWLVADGYVANYHETLNSLPLILVTSNWVRETYMRDGISGDNIEVLPVGCDTDSFRPFERSDPKVQSVREALGVSDDEVMILTVGGDAASKGGQEVMQALALIGQEAPPYKYVCKVWPQDRTTEQNIKDIELATTLGIQKNVVYSTSRNSREFMPYLLAACDIYAAPSRLEGFGMIQVEANACERPVIAIDAMAFKDTMVHGETAYLASVALENKITGAIVGHEQGFEREHRIDFPYLRTADFRASVHDLGQHLLHLMRAPEERARLGRNGRRRAVEKYDYRVVAKQFVEIVRRKLHIR
jgi:alpha-maltose-1-phosphate synthase